ncbi:hypothetical protein [Pseudomonas yamanorum]
MTTPRLPADLLPPVDIPLLQPPIPGDVDAADGDIGLRHVDNILESWAHPVYAKVIRSSGISDETERLRLRGNLQRSGGRDPDDETPGHQWLVYELPPDVLIDIYPRGV